MSKVELRAAYEWTCDGCGQDNFARALCVEMTPDDIQMLIEEHGGEPEDWQTGQWVTKPDEVTCARCGATYETEDWNAPEKNLD